MTLFKKAAKPVCEELVTVTTTEVASRIDRQVDDISDILEAGIMVVGLIASFFIPHNPVVKAAETLLMIRRY